MAIGELHRRSEWNFWNKWRVKVLPQALMSCYVEESPHVVISLRW